MKRGQLLLSASAMAMLSVLSAAASAADMPGKAPAVPLATPASWTGFYVGAHAGSGARSNTWSDGTGVLEGAFIDDTSWSGDGAAPIVGGQVGYNHQVGAFVLGLELDASAGQMNGFARCLGDWVSVCATGTDWLGTLTGRLGYAFGNALVYAKAGGALAHNGFSVSGSGYSGQFTGSDTPLGWTVGGGVELALTPQVSVKAEYAYLDFGSSSPGLQFGADSANATVSQSMQLVKLGLNWRPGAAPLPGTVAVPAGAARDWSGLYLGAHLGGAWGRNEWASPTGPMAQLTAYGTFPGAGDTLGLLGGAQAGYNVQMGALVAGIEASYSAADINGYAKCAWDGGVTSFSCRDTIDTLGLISGRLGWASGDMLVYAKAGAAWADASSTLQPTRDVESTSQSGTRWGWMLGAGVEYALGGNLSAFAEYNYVDFGSQTLTFGSPAGPFTVDLQQQIDMVRMGLNYRFGAPDTRAAAPPPPVGWTAEVGARWFASTGRMQKDLFAPVLTDRLNSRLIYANTTGQAGETFFRIDTDSPIFLKGYAGLGTLAGGSLYDEDYPAGTGYSNTLSSLSNGRLAYGAADIGYDFISQGGNTLGAFVGYRALYQSVNGYGCLQVGQSNLCDAGQRANLPAMLDNLGLSETELWQGVALGLNGRFQLTDRLGFEVDAAYLPYAVRSSYDNHWFRSDINPQAESGAGWGTQIEAILTYAVTDRLEVGLGGRYWFFTTDTASTQFPQTPARSPQTFYTERYGAFLQASYRFGDAASVGAAPAGIAKAPRAPAPPMNWTGFYAGGTLGAGKAHTSYDNPYGPSATGDAVDLGGALAGGQIGADYQFGAMVVGAEATAAWANIVGTNTCFATAPLGLLSGFNCGSDINAIGTVTARLGYAFDRALLYARGGFAWARQTDSLNEYQFTGEILSNGSTNTGWTLGVGIEYALLPNLSVGFEYKHYAFGGSSAFGTDDPAPLAGVDLAPANARIDAVAMTLNWRFDPLAVRPAP